MDRIVSRWRQRIDQLCKIRGRLEHQLMRPKFMRVGSVVKQYMFCGKPSCACHRDPRKKHGPYYYLSYKEQGQSRYKYLGKGNESRGGEGAELSGVSARDGAIGEDASGDHRAIVEDWRDKDEGGG